MKASPVLLSIALIALMLIPTEAASICLTKTQARELWPTRHIWWFIDKETGNRCWSNRRRGPPRGIKIDPIIPNHARAEVKDETAKKLLPAPKMEAPLRSDGPLQIIRDGCCWPKLTEFDMLWSKLVEGLKWIQGKN